MEPNKRRTPIRILLVEDNEHDRLAFRRALGESDIECEITECVRAEEALERLRGSASSFDIGVVDYALPGMSGFELCQELIVAVDDSYRKRVGTTCRESPQGRRR
jgi:CheY-like chemotaxis protein